MKMYRKHFASVMLLASIVVSSTAFAAPEDNVPNPIKGDAGIQMNRMRNYLERERVNRQIAEDRAAAKNKVEAQQKTEAKQGEALSFELKKIIFEPSAVLTEAELAAITKPYEGRMVKLDDIYAVVDKINELYTSKGYITCRAFLLPQTIADGTVKLLLVEGRTGTATVQGNKHTKTTFIKNRLHLQENEIANIKELNKDLL